MCKRLLLLIGLLWATANARAEEFVDPWFNEPLQPLSNQTWRTILTPNLTTADNKGEVLTQKCKLLKNEYRFVQFECDDFYDKDPKYRTIEEYRITNRTSMEYSSKYVVEHKSFDLPDILTSTESFWVRPPHMKTFANPLFYQPLEPVSKEAFLTKLTPELITVNKDGKELTQECDLFYNEQDVVKLSCTKLSDGSSHNHFLAIEEYHLKPDDDGYRVYHLHKDRRNEQMTHYDVFRIPADTDEKK